MQSSSIGQLAFILVLLSGLTPIHAQTSDAIMAKFGPYQGPSVEGANPSTLSGKVMTGYQGWFRCEGDGNEQGWVHYRDKNGRFEPGSCSIDFWPDVSELAPENTFETPFRHANGEVARVYSSTNQQAVLKHFEWMQNYGIDGAFVQRFTAYLKNPRALASSTQVLAHCREGANRHGRVYALMYDTDFDADSLDHIREDWKQLIDHIQLTKDPAYLRHEGKPVLALWGFGFTHREWDPEATREFFRFLKEDPAYGQLTILLGIPTHWLKLAGDCRPDPQIHEILQMADILCPWMVGRLSTTEQAQANVDQFLKPEIAWCQERGLDYLPVVFPGFSWHNLEPDSPLDQIPREGGKFLWSQFVAAKQAGATMIYQAMFDEVDEGTAIFKVSNDPPIGESRFLTYEGLPNDHYLWLTGKGGELLRGEIGEAWPERAP